MASCSLEPECSQDIEFEADPDISGIGVLTAFLLAAWSTYVIILVTYLFVKDGARQSELNDLDMIIKENLTWKRSSKQGSRSSPALSGAIQKVVLMLTNQQIVISSAVLILGYAKHCNITEYHFEIILDLAWLNFSTFQGSLLVTYGYFKEHEKTRHWRALWMTIEYVLLLPAQIVTFHDDWLWNPGRSTQCTWNNLGSNISPFSLAWLCMSLIVLTWNYLSLMSLFYPAWFGWTSYANKLTRAIFHKTSKLYNRIENSKRARVKTFFRWPAYFLFVASFTALEIVSSQALHFARDLTLLIYSTSYIFRTRNDAFNTATMVGDENEWTVGQILPLLLLALPLFSILESYYEAAAIQSPTNQFSPTITQPNQGEATQDDTEPEPISSTRSTPRDTPRYFYEYSEPPSGHDSSGTTAFAPDSGPVPPKKFGAAATFPLEFKTYNKIWFRWMLVVTLLAILVVMAVYASFGTIV